MDMEGTGDAAAAVWLQKLSDSVFQNDLILEMIFSYYVKTGADTLNVRLVNRAFYQKATRRLRALHAPIKLSTEVKETLPRFLDCMEARLFPDIFPFTSFHLTLHHVAVADEAEVLERFARIVGPHVRKYVLTSMPHTPRVYNAVDFARKVVRLLSRSPQVEEIELIVSAKEGCIARLHVGTAGIPRIILNRRRYFPAPHLPNEDVELMPQSFPRLKVIQVNCDSEALPAPPNSVPLVGLIRSRAPQL